MIDRSLMYTILTLLREQRALAGGTEENNLFNDVNLRASVPVTTPLLREHLQLAEDKGWATWRLDALRARRWRITQAGVDALTDLATGG
jgi:hypothetical protein